MNNVPVMEFGNQMLLEYFNIQPCNVKGRANISVEYYKRLLYNKLYGVFKFTLPKQWRENWFRFWLFHYGSIAVIYTKKYGWIAYPYGYKQLDLYYNPYVILVKTYDEEGIHEGVRGVNCELLHCFDDFFGFDDIVTNYATKLANIDKDININLMNTNLALVAKAENNKQAEEIKLSYKKATEGDPLVITNKSLIQTDDLTTFVPNPKNNFLVNDLLDAKRTIINEFLTHIGIANANTDKKERLITDEVNANNNETRALIDVVFENLQKGIEVLKSIDPSLEISVEMRYDEVNDDIVEVESEVVE